MDRTTWDERHADSEYLWTVAPNQSVEKHLAGLPAGTAIDLGAGEGRNAVWLAQQGWRVSAVDFSEVGLAKARQLAMDHGFASSVKTVVADALDYEPVHLVDLVVIAYLQLPAPDVQLILGHAVSWLKPGGTLLVVAHDRSNPELGHGGPSTEEVCYDVGSTVAAIADLEVETAEVVERDVETPDGIRTALDTLVVARRPT